LDKFTLASRTPSWSIEKLGEKKLQVMVKKFKKNYGMKARISTLPGSSSIQNISGVSSLNGYANMLQEYKVEFFFSCMREKKKE